jgi:DNA modification methylase
MIENYINKLFCKDNLELLKELPSNSIDLIYGDILYGTGKDWKDYKDINSNETEVNTFYYERIKEMKRVLKETGSIYLQMDTNINHYIKLMLNKIFGNKNFRNEIIWKRGNSSGFKTQYNGFIKNHDIILFYSKSDKYLFNKLKYDEYNGFYNRWKKYSLDNETITYINFPKSDKKWLNSLIEKFKKENNREPLNNDILYRFNSTYIEDIWTDISDIAYGSKEKIDYATQKPEKLLERIILASSNKNNIVLDCFLGSGTTIVVSEKLNRKWIGIDINQKSIEITNERLNNINTHQIKIKEKLNNIFEF